jgi:hypothetical protein
MVDDQTITYKVAIDSSGAKQGAAEVARAFNTDLAPSGVGNMQADFQKASQEAAALGNSYASMGTQAAASSLKAVAGMGEQEKVMARLSRLASQTAGTGKFTEVLLGRPGEMAEVLGSTGLLMASVAGIGVVAGTAAWNLGAFALQEEAVAKFGKGARTAVDDLNAAMKDLKLTLAQKLGLDTWVKESSQSLTVVANALAGKQEGVLQTQLDALKAQRQAAAEQPTPQLNLLGLKIDMPGGIGGLNNEAVLKSLDAEIAVATTRLAEFRKAAGEVDMGLVNLDGSAKYVTVDMSNMAHMADTGTAAIWRMVDAQYALNAPHAPAGPAYGTGTDFGAQLQAADKASGDATKFLSQEYQKAHDLGVSLAKSQYDQGVSLAKQQSDQAVQDWKTAVGGMESAFKSAVETVEGYAKGLLGPGKGDPLAPGKGGFAEGIYRVEDVMQNATKPGKDTAKWMGQYYPGMGAAEAQKAATADYGAFTSYDWGGLMQRGIIDEPGMKAYQAQQLSSSGNLDALTKKYGPLPGMVTGGATAQFGMTGMQPPVQQGAMQPPQQPGAIQQPGAAIGKALGAADLGTPLISQINALQNNADFLKASQGLGSRAAKEMSSAWVKEMPNTAWASAMEAAILASLIATFDKP